MSITDRDRQVLEHILRYCEKIEKPAPGSERISMRFCVIRIIPIL